MSFSGRGETRALPSLHESPALADLGEDRVLEFINRFVVTPECVVGIGDDTAVLPASNNSLLTTTDSLVEGVHFRLVPGAVQRLGEKALAVNLSDIAAMGGEPRYALVSVVARPETPLRVIDDLYRGLVSEAERFGVSIVGGNLSSTTGPLVLDVTVLGYASRDLVVLRSGARVGDVIAVTGTLGGAAARRWLVESGQEAEGTIPVPEPRIDIGRRLAAMRLPSAMMDLSDGLATDLHRLAAASGVGAVVNAGDIPVDIAARRIQDTRPLDLALYGGEDYELLLTLQEEHVPAAIEAAADVPLAVIGTVLAPEHGVLLEEEGGNRTPLPAGGWQHFRA